MTAGGDGTPELQRHFGLLQATALNVSMIVGAGVFITIPQMLSKLHSPWILLGWLAAGLLMLLDGLLWSELAAALPGSGGSYVYLLESYGRDRWGRLMAFLFVWQFLISGPLEVASGMIALALFSRSISVWFDQFTADNTLRIPLYSELDLGLTFDPSRWLAFGLCVLLLVLLYRRITALGRLTVTIWVGVLLILGWILIEGALHFDPAIAFAGASEPLPAGFGVKLGEVMALAMYSYLGYYNVCYIGDEVRDPGRTIPRAILLSSVLVVVLLVGVHLALLGTVSWQSIPTEGAARDTYNLPAEFMQLVRGRWAAVLISLMLLWTCCGSAFAALLGYSRIPFGAARYGHFFSVLAKVHPRHRIPHVSLLLVGGLTLFWTFFDLGAVITALIVTRVIEQFIGQCVGVMLLRQTRPDLPRPFRMWLYPLPALLALAGWLYLYVTSDLLYILLGVATLVTGVGVFLVWSRGTRRWPF